MLQTSVDSSLGAGVIGEVYLDGPFRAKPGIIDSTGETYPNRIGRVFTGVSGSDGHVTVGGAIGNGTPFAGILMSPKMYALYGTSSDSLAASLDLAQYTEAEFTDMCSGLWVTLSAAAARGDIVDYQTTSGLLIPRKPLISFTGSIATTTLTVSAIDSDSAPIQVGAELTGDNVTPGTIITSDDGGSGGAGDYTVSVSQTAASGTITAPSLPASGSSVIPRRALVERYETSASGLAVISLT